MLLRKEANLLWYESEKEETLPLPKLPAVAETIAKLDPSPPYLRCKNCNGRLIRDLQSSVCVFCGMNPHTELAPEPIKFKTTIGYRWLLEALQLDGTEMVEPVVDKITWNRGRSESKEETPLSELLDLEIRWPLEAERALSSTSDSIAFLGRSTLNLAGVDLDSFFEWREDDYDEFERNLASGRKVGVALDNTSQANVNLSFFQNVQASKVAVDNRGVDSFSGWEANFMSASSSPVHEEVKSVDHSKVESNMVSRSWKDSVCVKKNDDIDPTASAEHDYFQGDGWRTSNTEVNSNIGKSESIIDVSGTKTIESANGSSRNLDWMLDDQQQGSDIKTTDTVAIAEDKYSFDEWNGFAGSGNTQDPSNTISCSKTIDQTGNLGFSVDFNNTKTTEDFNDSSNKDFDRMQDQWQDNNNKTIDAISANEVDDSFDAWNDFTDSANVQHSSFSVSNSEIIGQTGKFGLTQDLIDTKIVESADVSSRKSFDWTQDDQWQFYYNKTADTSSNTDSFDIWNDFTSLAAKQDQTSVEKSSKSNLPSASNNSYDIEFSGFPQHDLLLGQFGTSLSSLPVTSNRVAEVDISRGNSEDVSTAVGSRDGIEMLMSEMHDLSFMLENTLPIPPK